MADLSGAARFWLSLLRRPISLWARPHVLPEDLRRRFGQPQRPICYILEMHSVADVVVLEKVCAAHGLPEPLQPLKPPLPSRSVFFLERFAGFWGDRIDPRISQELRQLVKVAAADPTLDVDLLPVSVFWGRAPHNEGSWIRPYRCVRSSTTERIRRGRCGVLRAPRAACWIVSVQRRSVRTCPIDARSRHRC
jgi:glycerol-3-phosphate O-acyltransferase